MLEKYFVSRAFVLVAMNHYGKAAVVSSRLRGRKHLTTLLHVLAFGMFVCLTRLSLFLSQTSFRSDFSFFLPCKTLTNLGPTFRIS